MNTESVPTENPTEEEVSNLFRSLFAMTNQDEAVSDDDSDTQPPLQRLHRTAVFVRVPREHSAVWRTRAERFVNSLNRTEPESGDFEITGFSTIKADIYSVDANGNIREGLNFEQYDVKEEVLQAVEAAGYIVLPHDNTPSDEWLRQIATDSGYMASIVFA